MNHVRIPAAVLLACACAVASAQTPPYPIYPTKPIRLISPYAPGGGSDTLARIIGQKLLESWGQPVVVDCRPSSGGILGAELVARAAPDGYTLFVTPSAVLTINPHLYAKLRYDSFKDLTPVIAPTNSPYFLVVHPKIPAVNVKELITYAKANPGKLNYSSSGSGTSGHLAGVLFGSLANIDIVHIPYKGAAPATVDLLAGQVQLRFSSVVPALPHVRGGRLRGLAVSSAKRYSPMPEVPTVAESGLPGYAVESFYVVMAPTGTPRAIIEKLNSEITRKFKDAEVNTRMAADGAEVIASSIADTAKMLRDDFNRWAKPVKDSGARAD
jgi:tripartite-type tricarboxylate transporter receptor subunit TctC